MEEKGEKERVAQETRQYNGGEERGYSVVHLLGYRGIKNKKRGNRPNSLATIYFKVLSPLTLLLSTVTQLPTFERLREIYHLSLFNSLKLLP